VKSFRDRPCNYCNQLPAYHSIRRPLGSWFKGKRLRPGVVVENFDQPIRPHGYVFDGGVR
jgi:hypothetical protein